MTSMFTVNTRIIRFSHKTRKHLTLFNISYTWIPYEVLYGIIYCSMYIVDNTGSEEVYIICVQITVIIRKITSKYILNYICI